MKICFVQYIGFLKSIKCDTVKTNKIICVCINKLKSSTNSNGVKFLIKDFRLKIVSTQIEIQNLLLFREKYIYCCNFIFLLSLGDLIGNLTHFLIDIIAFLFLLFSIFLLLFALWVMNHFRRRSRQHGTAEKVIISSEPYTESVVESTLGGVEYQYIPIYNLLQINTIRHKILRGRKKLSRTGIFNFCATCFFRNYFIIRF